MYQQIAVPFRLLYDAGGLCAESIAFHALGTDGHRGASTLSGILRHSGRAGQARGVARPWKRTDDAWHAECSYDVPRRILDPLERTSEILFGIIMVLTFTGSIRVADAGREGLRTVLGGRDWLQSGLGTGRRRDVPHGEVHGPRALLVALDGTPPDS